MSGQSQRMVEDANLRFELGLQQMIRKFVGETGGRITDDQVKAIAAAAFLATCATAEDNEPADPS